MHHIAIIGRPNAGKSTLFNRLTGKKLAITHDEPGVTRDWRREKASLGPMEFYLTDTAGLESARKVPDKAIAEKMLESTRRAVREQDLLLFMIDGKEGVTPQDKSFAQEMRKTGKPVIVLVNKCEGKAGEAAVSDAFRLGFGEPVAISAEHGLGLTDLYDAIDAALENVPHTSEDVSEAEAQELIRISLIGRPNVGKSTLLNQLLGEERAITHNEAGTTRDAIYTRLEHKGKQVLLVDTAGIRRKSRVKESLETMSVQESLRAIKYANICVLMLDATQALETQDLQLADLVAREGRGLVIAVNKWDLVEDPQALLKAIYYRLEEALPQVKGVAVVHLSALYGKNVERVLAACFKAYQTWNMRITTGALNRWLDAALTLHPPPLIRRSRLKIKYITQAKTRPPGFVLFASHEKEFPETYLRYLSNHIREAFDFQGVPIRMHVRAKENPFVKKK